MSPEEVAAMLALLQTLTDTVGGTETADGLLQKLDQLIFLTQVGSLGIACVWGAMIWQAVIVGKNQRRL